jgi:hypothetical protein
MLKILLDEHLSPRIAKQLLSKAPRAWIASVLEWQAGSLVGAPDHTLLVHAHQHSLTLVTYDQATIVPLLKEWGEQGINHSGVVFIDDRTIRQHDTGAIVRALVQLCEKQHDAEWRNRVVYLTRQG